MRISHKLFTTRNLPRTAICLVVGLAISNPAISLKWTEARLRFSNSCAYAQDSEKSGVSDKEILIGSCSALSGPTEYLGKQQIIGAKTYIDSINDQGGVNGRKVKLLTLDDCYEPEKAINCFTQLVKENVFAVAFLVGTPTAAKHIPIGRVSKNSGLGLIHWSSVSVRACETIYFRGARVLPRRDSRDGRWVVVLRKAENSRHPTKRCLWSRRQLRRDYGTQATQRGACSDGLV